MRAIPRIHDAALRAVLALSMLPLAGAAAAAAAQDAGAPSDAVSIPRLRFEFKCCFKVQEWREKGEEPFLRKLLEQKAIYKAKLPAQLPAIEALVAEAYWERKGDFEGRDPERADEMASQILALESKKDPVVAEYVTKAAAFFIKRKFDAAQRFERSGSLPEARTAYKLCINAPDRTIGQQAVTALVRIAKTNRKFDEILGRNELSETGEMLASVLEDLKADLETSFDAYLKGAGDIQANAELKSLDVEREKIARSTQRIQVVVRDVAAALADVKGPIVDASAVTYSFEPTGEGQKFPVKGGSAALPKNPFLWHKGVYTVRAFAPKSERPFATFVGVALKDAMPSIEVPNRAPEGMVWQPPVKAGGEALFVDRYEVTVAQVDAAVQAQMEGFDKFESAVKDSRDFQATDDCPAFFDSEEKALAYAKAMGKVVPTAAQWLQAAFAGRPPADLTYPWGREDIDDKRAYASKVASRPDSVGKRQLGAAPCGAEDMVGNLAEWVRHGDGLWLMGGHYAMGEADLKVVDGKIAVRDPMPGPVAYAALGAQQNAYVKFKFTADDGYWAGLRLVVVVPAK